MLDDVYNRRILQLAADIPRLGRLDVPHGRATAHSRLCGSTVSVEITLDADVVSDFAQDIKACALGQASAAVMGRAVPGSTLAELIGVRDEMRRMLKENGSAPSGKWADLAFLEPVRDYKARHASTLLIFDATVAAFENALAARTPA